MAQLRSSARRGFSLIELVVVLAILGTLAMIAMPRYATSVARYRADAAARRLIDDFAYARSAADAASDARTVTFDVGASTYTMADLTNPRTGVMPYVVELRIEPYGVTIVSAVFDDPGSIDDGIEAVTFDGFGRPDSAVSVVLSVSGETRTVILDAVTGAAVVQQ